MMNTEFWQHRPKGFQSLGDSRLPRLMDRLTRRLIDVQDEFAHDTLYLPDGEFRRLAHVLVEFAEDIRHGIGIWESLEQYNRELFGTPLPLTLPIEPATAPTPLLPERISHLLWVLYAEINPDLVLSPTHPDLGRLAAVSAKFLGGKMKRRWQQSGVKQFLLGQRNKYGWEVKRKLIWLGQHSYLFRYNFHNYVANQGGKADVSTIDDYVCQETTPWSGLGVIDILARVLPLNETQQADLRSWYERHAAFYEIAKHLRRGLTVINLMTGEPYQVYQDVISDRFTEGAVVYGSLVPWEGEWYWSGEQRLLGPLSDSKKEELRTRMIRRSSNIVYRYDKERLAKAQETVEQFEQAFVDYHGDHLAVFPDGSSMAASMQEMHRLHNESIPGEERAEAMAKYDGTSTTPEIPFPPEVLENENGAAVFFNPGEGTEIIVDFYDVLNGFKKQGSDLTQTEKIAIRDFIQGENISPQFVQHLVRDHGDESVASAFLIRNRAGHPYLDYLLRRYKGHFYRNRYPFIALV